MKGFTCQKTKGQLVSAWILPQHYQLPGKIVVTFPGVYCSTLEFLRTYSRISRGTRNDVLQYSGRETLQWFTLMYQDQLSRM
jgi:hypothetical protein